MEHSQALVFGDMKTVRGLNYRLMKRIVVFLSILLASCIVFGQNCTQQQSDSMKISLCYDSLNGWSARIKTLVPWLDSTTIAPFSGAWFPIAGSEGTSYTILRGYARDTIQQYDCVAKPEEPTIIHE